MTMRRITSLNVSLILVIRLQDPSRNNGWLYRNLDDNDYRASADTILRAGSIFA